MGFMHAVTIENGEILWRPHPDPVPSDTQVLVKVRASSLNRADLLQRDGRYPPPPGTPADIPGIELAGEVLSCGARVETLKPGDHIASLVPGAGQAELACVEESTAMKLPPDLSWEQAGGFSEVFSTAYDALFDQCALRVGEKVLITGAAGGVGTAAVQLASLAGASVTASARNARDRAQDLMDLGASLVIDAEDEASLSEHAPWSVLLELVGAPSLEKAIPHLANDARISVTGIGAGARAQINLGLLLNKRLRLTGATLRGRSLPAKALLARSVASNVLPFLAAKRIRVPIAATFPMEHAADAYQRFEAGGKLGKIILTT